METSRRGDLTIRPPREPEQPVVMALALAALPAEARTAAIAAALDAAHEAQPVVIGAWRAGRLVEAVWGEVHAGRAAVAQLPQRVEGEAWGAAVALLLRLEGQFTDRNVRFYQIQLEAVAAEDLQILTAAGLQSAGDLVYLYRDDLAPRPAAPACGLTLATFEESDRARLARVIERTYQGSRDLPALDGVRTMEEVLEGYHHTGVFNRDLWKFIVQAGEDIGCLLLTAHPHCQRELVYMGLVPEARGKGFGAVVVAHAIDLARVSGGQQLLLGVDALNEPAIAAYRRAEFRPWRRTTVFLKILHAAQTNSARPQVVIVTT